MDSVRVSQILYSGLGGHGSVVFSLIQADINKEWIHQLIFYGIEDLLPAYKQYCEQTDLPYKFILKKKGFFHSRFFTLYKALRTQNPDTIILHSPTLSLHIKLYCILHQKKMVVVEHTPNEVKSIGEWMGTFFSLFASNKIVYLTLYYKQEIAKKFKWLNVKKRSVIIPNGLNLEQYKQHSKQENDILHLGMAGRFSSNKNQQLLTSAFIEFIRQKRISKKIILNFAGTGETCDEIMEMVKKSGDQICFKFHGFLNEVGMIEFYKLLDIYIHASKGETMCTAIMQAMACGLPVIGSNIPGINNLVQDNETGLLFENDSQETLINCILALAADKDKRREMGAKGRKYAEENFSAAITFEKYNNQIQTL